MSKVLKIIEQEKIRQASTIELIASENFVSDNVLRAVGSCLANKYSESYPAERTSGNKGRYYGGCYAVDALEEYCCNKWREVFQTCYHVNVQPHSGSNANLAAFMAVLRPGDTVLAMDLNHGGRVFGVELTAKEHKAMEIEINRQIVEADKLFSEDDFEIKGYDAAGLANWLWLNSHQNTCVDENTLAEYDVTLEAFKKELEFALEELGF